MRAVWWYLCMLRSLSWIHTAYKARSVCEDEEPNVQRQDAELVLCVRARGRWRARAVGLSTLARDARGRGYRARDLSLTAENSRYMKSWPECHIEIR